MKKLLIATRKGLFAAEDRNGWSPRPIGFVGDPVSIALFDSRDDSLYAALNLGHFGVKLHRSSDGGATWSEIACPSFPKQTDAERKSEEDWPKASPWSVAQIWSLEAGDG